MRKNVLNGVVDIFLTPKKNNTQKQNTSIESVANSRGSHSNPRSKYVSNNSKLTKGNLFSSISGKNLHKFQ